MRPRKTFNSGFVFVHWLSIVAVVVGLALGLWSLQTAMQAALAAHRQAALLDLQRVESHILGWHISLARNLFDPEPAEFTSSPFFERTYTGRWVESGGARRLMAALPEASEPLSDLQDSLKVMYAQGFKASVDAPDFSPDLGAHLRSAAQVQEEYASQLRAAIEESGLQGVAAMHKEAPVTMRGVLEDNESVRQMMERSAEAQDPLAMLIEKGYHIETAVANVAKAVREGQTDPPDALLTQWYGVKGEVPITEMLDDSTESIDMVNNWFEKQMQMRSAAHNIYREEALPAYTDSRESINKIRRMLRIADPAPADAVPLTERTTQLLIGALACVAAGLVLLLASASRSWGRKEQPVVEPAAQQ